MPLFFIGKNLPLDLYQYLLIVILELGLLRL